MPWSLPSDAYLLRTWRAVPTEFLRDAIAHGCCAYANACRRRVIELREAAA